VRAYTESDDETAELEVRHAADLAFRLAAKHKERDRWLHLYAQDHISIEGELGYTLPKSELKVTTSSCCFPQSRLTSLPSAKR
jgi:hypothetical protein